MWWAKYSICLGPRTPSMCDIESSSRKALRTSAACTGSSSVAVSLSASSSGSINAPSTARPAMVCRPPPCAPCAFRAGLTVWAEWLDELLGVEWCSRLKELSLTLFMKEKTASIREAAPESSTSPSGWPPPRPSPRGCTAAKRLRRMRERNREAKATWPTRLPAGPEPGGTADAAASSRCVSPPHADSVEAAAAAAAGRPS